MSNHPNRSRRGNDAARNPTPAEIRTARENAGLSQTDAGALIYAGLRAWQGWEAPEGDPQHRRMHPGLWELFLIKIGSKS